LEIVEGTETLVVNAESVAARKGKDMQAHSIFTQTIDDKVLANLLSCEFFSQIRHKLILLHEQKSTEDIHHL
jgi:hypothetical protein